MAIFGRPSMALLVIAAVAMHATGELPVVDIGGIHIGPATESTSSSTSTSTISSSTSTSPSTTSSSTPSSTSSSSTSSPSSSSSTTSPTSSPSSSSSSTLSTTVSTSLPSSPTSGSTVSSSISSSPTSGSTVPSSTLSSTTQISTSSSSSTSSPSTISSSVSSSTSTVSQTSSSVSSSTLNSSHSTSPVTIQMVVSMGNTTEIFPQTSAHTLGSSNVSISIQNTTTAASTISAQDGNHSTSIISKTSHLANTTILSLATNPSGSPSISNGTSTALPTNASISSSVVVNGTSSPSMTTVIVSSSISNKNISMVPGGHPPTLSDFDCSNFEPGYYGNPKQACDTKFYICVSRSMNAYEQQCPAKLFFDADLKICESWIHIPACSGKPRPTVIASNETHFTLPTAAPVIDCFNLTDGNYPDPLSTPKAYCSNRFFTCVGSREFQFFCPRGLFYDHDRNQCDLYERVFVCSGNHVVDEKNVTWAPALTWAHVDFSCTERADGYYVEKCDSVYYSCNGGLAREFRCPDDLVFDSEWLSCEAPRDTLICSGTRRPSTERPSSTVSHSAVVTSPWPLNCRGQVDGIYRDPAVKCSRVFYYCTHNDTVHNYCPGNLYYDDEFKRCDLWINIFDCSGMRPTSTLKQSSTVAPSILPAVDFDCSRIEDGNYANPKEKCSKFFYICANMEAFKQYCPAGLYYDIDSNTCDSWANVFVCSGITHRPVEPSKATLSGTTEKPEFDCSLKSDGVYTNAVNACSGVYFRCVGSNTFKFFCPGGLFYDTTIDRCDLFNNVFACSGLTRPAPTSSTSKPSTPSTEKPPIDCRSLPDGDYPDPLAKNKCSHIFYTCSSGFGVKRDCADGLYYDVDYHVCNEFWKVPECTGSPRPVTVSVPVTIHTSGPPLAFDCTKLFDGNYPDKDCSGDFWSCVGGTTFQRRCPLSFVYDAEFDDCEYPALVPKCGGHRITTPKHVDTPSTTPVGGFSCAFLQDGNYIDPAVKDGCSSIYYTCSNGMTTRVHCPAELFYDVIGNECNSRDRVPACGGSAPNVTMALNTPSSTLPSTTVVPSTMLPVVSVSSSSSSVPTTASSSLASSSSVPTTISSSSVPTTASTSVPTTASTSVPTTASTTASTSVPTTASTSAPTTTHLTTTSRINTAIVSKILQGNFTEIVTEIMTDTTTAALRNLTSETAKPSVGELVPEMTTVLPTIVASSSTPTTQLPVTISLIKNETETMAPATSTELPSTITTRRQPKVVTKILRHNFTEIVTEHVEETPSQSPATSVATSVPTFGHNETVNVNSATINVNNASINVNSATTSQIRNGSMASSTMTASVTPAHS